MRRRIWSSPPPRAGGRLFRPALLLLTNDRHLAEDLVQETLGKMPCSWRKVERTADRIPTS